MTAYRIPLVAFLLLALSASLTVVARGDDKPDGYAQAIADAQKAANAGDFLEAFAAAKRAVAAKPDGYQGHYLAAYAAWKLNQPEKATAEAGQALELAPPNAKIEAKMLVEAVRQSAAPPAPVPGAGEAAKPLPTTGKDDNRAAYEQCVADAHKPGRDSISLWTKAQQLEPAEPEPYLRLAERAYQDTHYDDALADVKSGAANCPRMKEVLTEDLGAMLIAADPKIRRFLIDTYGDPTMARIKDLPMRKLKDMIREINEKGNHAALDGGGGAETRLTLSADEKHLIINSNTTTADGVAHVFRASIPLYQFQHVGFKHLNIVGQDHGSSCVIMGPRDAVAATIDGKVTDATFAFFTCSKEESGRLFTVLGLYASWVKGVSEWPQ